MGTVKFGIDFGSNSIKVAFCRQRPDGTPEFGKLALDGRDIFYSFGCWADGQWIFGRKVFDLGNDFRRVVRIKDMFALIGQPEYDSLHQLPEFEPDFVTNRRNTDWFDIAKDTPCSICEAFFDTFVSEFFVPAVAQLRQKHPDWDFDEVPTCLLTYDDDADDAHKNELARLLTASGAIQIEPGDFEQRSTSEAIAIFAYMRGQLREDEYALVVNIGRRKTSVAAVFGCNLIDYITVAEGVGGTSYNRQIYEHIRDTASDIGTHAQLFHLEQSIDIAKARLNRGDMIVEFGDLATTRHTFNRQAFGQIVADSHRQIAQLVSRELAVSRKYTAKKIILSGGAAATCGLLDAVRAEVGDRASVVTLADQAANPDKNDLGPDQLKYAQAVGAAALLAMRYRTKSVTPRGYGVRVTDGNNRSCIQVIIAKNSPMPAQNRHTFFIEKSWAVINPELYSVKSPDDIVPIGGDAPSEAQMVASGEITPLDVQIALDLRTQFAGGPMRTNVPIVLTIAIDANGNGSVSAHTGQWLPHKAQYLMANGQVVPKVPVPIKGNGKFLARRK